MSSSDAPDYGSHQREPERQISHLVYETRELVIRIDAKLDAYLEARETDSARLAKVEQFCEEKRRQISELQPVLPVVFGSGPHNPGLIAEIAALKSNTVTWRAIMAIAGVTATIWGVIASSAMAIWHELGWKIGS